MVGNTAYLNRQLIHLNELIQAQRMVVRGDLFNSDETTELFDGLEKEIKEVKKTIEYILHYKGK